MKLVKLLVIALFAVQLAVPAYMIYEQNTILEEGRVYKFKTRPIDPYDPFRGRYVTLRFEANSEAIPAESSVRRGDWVYALLDLNKEGYAVITKLVTEQPEDGVDYIHAEVSWGSGSDYRVYLPFNRYYAPEDSAIEIERAVWRRQRETVEDVYAEVAVLDGKATLKELYINQLPALEYIKEKNKAQ